VDEQSLLKVEEERCRVHLTCSPVSQPSRSSQTFGHTEEGEDPHLQLIKTSGTRL